jgi:hypothetical protein
MLTSIFHPNVSPSNGDICVSSLQKDWRPDLGISHLLLALKSLLLNPNPESALNEVAGRLLLEDYAAFCRRAALMSQLHAGAPPCPRHVSDGTGPGAIPRQGIAVEKENKLGEREIPLLQVQIGGRDLPCLVNIGRMSEMSMLRRSGVNLRG